MSSKTRTLEVLNDTLGELSWINDVARNATTKKHAPEHLMQTQTELETNVGNNHRKRKKTKMKKKMKMKKQAPPPKSSYMPKERQRVIKEGSDVRQRQHSANLPSTNSAHDFGIMTKKSFPLPKMSAANRSRSLGALRRQQQALRGHGDHYF